MINTAEMNAMRDAYHQKYVLMTLGHTQFMYVNALKEQCNATTSEMIDIFEAGFCEGFEHAMRLVESANAQTGDIE